jgi:alkylation response protein AidB-like acyl-CoA dehydrogenase
VARFLDEERATLEAFLPGLDAKLAAAELEDLERPGSPEIQWFREAGGPGLFVASDTSGLGATLAQGVQIQRAIGSRAPSLAVASTMHHFSVASLIEWGEQAAGLEWLLSEGIARQRLLVASGVAESVPGSDAVTPKMTGVETDDGLIVRGSKKPCSLSRSMDLMFASVAVPDGRDGPQWAIAVIAADSPGIVRKPFWKTNVLAATESDEVVLTDVFVPKRLVSFVAAPGESTPAVRGAFVWFELLIAAAYLGMASGLLERALQSSRADPGVLAEIGIELEGAAAALLGVAQRANGGGGASGWLGQSLAARYLVQDAIARSTARALEAMGGGAFIASESVGYLYAACRCLAFHPPARPVAREAMVAHLRGSQVDVR